MATSGVLERSEKKHFIDDTIPLTVNIVNYKAIQKPKYYVEYVLKVQRGPGEDDSWEVNHRYSEFDALATTIQVSGIPLPLPPKKMFGATERQFLSERLQGLQTFITAILSYPLLSNSLVVKKFLDPKNYSDNFYEIALRNVSMFFRSEPQWKVVQPLRDMGWRIRKQYYLIASKNSPKPSNHLLSWCEPGPDFSFSEKDFELCLKVLSETNHPFILSPVLATFNGTGVMIVREFVSSGSLKDIIYEKTPKLSVLEKYSQPARIRKLSIANIKQYGRQILEALNFLSEKGFVVGHVHAGNVLICDGNCKLVDIENSLMGIPSLYRHHLIEVKKLRSHLGEAVYSFGHLLYEMCAGTPLRTAMIENTALVNTFPTEIAQIIESILTPQAIKEGLPSLSDLLSNSFFSEGYGVPPSEKPYMRVPSKLKEVIKSHLEKAELRLFSEQKKAAQYRRLSKAHENLMSEEEKKKRKKMRRKQLSMQEEEEPQSYPTTTSLPRQNTIGTSGVSHAKKQATSNGTTSPASNGRNTNSSNSKNTQRSKSATVKATPPPSAAAPDPRPNPPPTRGTGERGALLGSIEGFAKGKLKKTVTNDRSQPLIR